MKLRIKGNSIRLRLGRSEVCRMLTHGMVEESVTFGAYPLRQCLRYALCAATNVYAVTASYEDGRIVVRLPADLVVDWAATDEVGIEGVQVPEDGESLRILIEKDFECVEPGNGESQADAYRRPEPGMDSGCPPIRAV